MAEAAHVSAEADSHSDLPIASTSNVVSTEQHQAQNEACVACRQIKRKCIHELAGQTCQRCLRLQLECVYQQQRRGRKAQSSLESAPSSAQSRERHSAEVREGQPEPKRKRTASDGDEQAHNYDPQEREHNLSLSEPQLRPIDTRQTPDWIYHEALQPKKSYQVHHSTSSSPTDGGSGRVIPASSNSHFSPSGSAHSQGSYGSVNPQSPLNILAPSSTLTLRPHQQPYSQTFGQPHSTHTSHESDSADGVSSANANGARRAYSATPIINHPPRVRQQNEYAYNSYGPQIGQPPLPPILPPLQSFSPAEGSTVMTPATPVAPSLGPILSSHLPRTSGKTFSLDTLLSANNVHAGAEDEYSRISLADAFAVEDQEENKEKKEGREAEQKKVSEKPFMSGSKSIEDGRDGRNSIENPERPRATDISTRSKIIGSSTTDTDNISTGRVASTIHARDFEDIATTGIVDGGDIDGFFEFYFAHLNPMTSLLDPELHTAAFCRSKSAFLFSAIVTVAAKVLHPSLYPACLKYAKRLLGEAFQYGVSTIELVQAIATLAFWSDAVDDSGARRLSYAIRCAFELGLYKKTSRPLPKNEIDARRILNRERTWLHLCVADHRFATQRSVPRMIPADRAWDPITWILEHIHIAPCPSEAGLAPLIALQSPLNLYGLLVESGEGEMPNKQLLGLCEAEVSSWTAQWAGPETTIPLLEPHQAQIRFYAKALRFQLDEVHLLLAIAAASAAPSGLSPNMSDTYHSGNTVAKAAKLSHHIPGSNISGNSTMSCEAAHLVAHVQPLPSRASIGGPNPNPTKEAQGSPLVVFRICIKAALAVLHSLRGTLKPHWIYVQDSMWIGAASCAIWLSQNISGMAPEDRASVLEALQKTQLASSSVQAGPQHMAAYTARLLSHLLAKIHLGIPSKASQQQNENAGSQHHTTGKDGKDFAREERLSVQSDQHSDQNEPHTSHTDSNQGRPMKDLQYLGNTVPSTPPVFPSDRTSDRVDNGTLSSNFSRPYVSASYTLGYEPLWQGSGVNGVHLQNGGINSASPTGVQTPLGTSVSWDVFGMHSTSSAMDGGNTHSGTTGQHDQFLNAMLRPAQNIIEDQVYPNGDDRLWQSLFPLFGRDN